MAEVGEKRRGRPAGSKDTKPRKPYTPRGEPVIAQCALRACGKAFTLNVPHQRFCCRPCGVKADNEVKSAERKLIKPRACLQCKVSYTPERGNRWKHYCSEPCRKQSRALFGNGSTHRRRAKRYGVEHQTVNKLKVFERDEWRCHLCGCDTPRDKRGKGEANSPELDHVIPLSRGGAHTYGNTRCACRACNLAKGNSLPGERRGGESLSDAGIRSLA
jgi:5-methylcytosine-specific restriction endonuclease McrA